MPERRDRVTVSLDDRDVTLTWDTRQALMQRLYDADIKASTMQRESTAGILHSFEAVGGTRPVELATAQRALLLEVLRYWSAEREWSIDRDAEQMPMDLVILRDALSDDLAA